MRNLTAASSPPAHNFVSMSEREEVLRKIHVLMDEQMRALRSELNVHVVLDYGQRTRQIAALLEKLNLGGDLGL